MQCPTLPEDWLLVESIFHQRWNFPMPWVPWMEGIFQSDVHKGEAASSATARASTPLYSWPWQMEIPSSCGWTWRQPGQPQMIRFSSTPILGTKYRRALEIGGPKVNFFILGDDAFPLKLWIMRLYSSHPMDLKEMVFNYRIRQGRTVVENAFGMLTSRFRIFQSPLQQEFPVVNRVVMACLVLHNLLGIRYPIAQQEDFGMEGQPTIVLEGNDIPYEGCNAIGAAKR